MLNLEWVTKKLLPSVIERRSVTAKKKPATVATTLTTTPAALLVPGGALSPASPALSSVSSPEATLNNTNASPSPTHSQRQQQQQQNDQLVNVTTSANNTAASFTTSASPSLLNSPTHSVNAASLPSKNVSDQQQTQQQNLENTTTTSGGCVAVEEEKNPFEGQYPESVVTPQVFSAILDEALAVLTKPMVSQKRKQEQKELIAKRLEEQRKIANSMTVKEKVLALNPFLREEQERQISSTIFSSVDQQNSTIFGSSSLPLSQHNDFSAPNEVFPEITLHQGFSSSKRNKNRKVYTFGPIRGHAVPLATMLLNLINDSISGGKPLPSFVFLGDLIDSGPNSIETVAVVLALMVAYEKERERVASDRKKRKEAKRDAQAQAREQQQQQQQQQQQLNQAQISPTTTGHMSVFGTPMLRPTTTGAGSCLGSAAETSLQNNNNNITIIPPPLEGLDTLTAVGATSSPSLKAVNSDKITSSSSLQQQQETALKTQKREPVDDHDDDGGDVDDEDENDPHLLTDQGPVVIVLRGRHEHSFPAPTKWTGSSTNGGYRRLDDELNATFGDNLDNTRYSLVNVLAKLKDVFSWLPVACMIRCRVKQGTDRPSRKSRATRTKSSIGNIDTLSFGDDQDQKDAADDDDAFYDDLTPEEDFYYQQNRIQQTSFLCLPGGPSPALLRYSSFADMKEVVEAAVFRTLRSKNPLLQQQPGSAKMKSTSNQVPTGNNTQGGGGNSQISPAQLPAAAVSNNSIVGLPPAVQEATPTTTAKKKFSSRPPKASVEYSRQQQKRQDEQIIKDLATAEPHEDDEDRAATNTGILFSDNPDNTRDPGMCSFSTEAAATFLARCGAHCILRGSSFSLQRILVSAPNKIKKNIQEFQEEQLQRASSSSRRSSLNSTLSSTLSATGTSRDTSKTSSRRGANDEKPQYTFRPKASPYDPGFRMYRLPSHVKRAVQKGAVPNFGVCASPLSLSQNNSAQDLTALGGYSTNNSSNNSSQNNSLIGSKVETPTTTQESQFLNHYYQNQMQYLTTQQQHDLMLSMLGARMGSTTSIASSGSNASQLINSNFARNLLTQHAALIASNSNNNTNGGSTSSLLPAGGSAGDLMMMGLQSGSNLSNNNNNSVEGSSQPILGSFPTIPPPQARKNKKKKPAVTAATASSVPFLPQIISLFSAPHFGCNFKSRNFGCTAVIQCAESKLNTGNNNPDFSSNYQNQYGSIMQEEKQRGAVVSLVQFEDPNPLLFAPYKIEIEKNDIEEEQVEEEEEEDQVDETTPSNNNKIDIDNSFVSDDDIDEQETDTTTTSTAALMMQQKGKQFVTAGRDLPSEIEFSLTEQEEAFLHRMKRMCFALKERGQLEMVQKKQII